MLSDTHAHSAPRLYTDKVEGFVPTLFVKMKVLILIAALCATAYCQQEQVERVMDNVLILRVPGGRNTRVHVPLTCGEAYGSQEIFWKKDALGGLGSEELVPPLLGNQVSVMVEETRGGNYSCHQSPGGEYLNHTMILVQQLQEGGNGTLTILEESRHDGHIHCTAPNYKGTFHCKWRKTRPNAAVLLFNAERNMEAISCEVDADGSGLVCHDINCPYKEEQHRIVLTVYMRSFSKLEVYTKTFYLREIVRPLPLPNLHLSAEGVFSWSYPESWEEPRTFFGLNFEVKVVHRGNTCHSNDNILVRNTTDQPEFRVQFASRKYVFCVRAQDKHTNGPWSHWSFCNVNKNNVQC